MYSLSQLSQLSLGALCLSMLLGAFIQPAAGALHSTVDPSSLQTNSVQTAPQILLNLSKQAQLYAASNNYLEEQELDQQQPKQRHHHHSQQHLQQQQQQQQQKQQQQQQHDRRILNDAFGILRESIFNTNNHIGFKGVPKFGSEEEY